MDDGPGDQSESTFDAQASSDSADSESDSSPPQLQTRKPAWTDSSTSPHHISLLSGSSRLRKLRHFDGEDQITAKDYENRLRVQFERINPEPAWAQRARKQNRKEHELPGGVDDEGDVLNREAEDVDVLVEEKRNLFTSTSGILVAAEKRRQGPVVLPSGTLAISRLRDANLSTQDTASGEVKVVAFHPNDRVPILCVGTSDRRVRLYHVRITLSSKSSKWKPTPLGRRAHLTPPPNTPHSLSSTNLIHLCHFSPFRLLSPHLRSSSLFFHTRSPDRHHDKTRTRTMGHHVCRQP